MERNYESMEKSRFVSTSSGTSIVGHICNKCTYNQAQFSSFGKHPHLCCFDQTEYCSEGMPHSFFLRRTSDAVIIFSKSRLPYELPKSNSTILRKLKDEITFAIKQLQPCDRSALYARYGTTDATKDFFDIENVLFYNIGTSTFNTLAKHRVLFAVAPHDEIRQIREHWNIPEEYSHYYEYSILSKPAPCLPTKELLAEWEQIPFCKCQGLTPLSAWNSIKNAESKIKIYHKIHCDASNRFSLSLEIEKPPQVKMNIMSAMKALLDGIICAFHSSVFNEKEIEYFTKKLNCDSDRIQSKHLDVLGERQNKYIQKYGNHIKWNPADNFCQCVTISIIDGTEWRLSGKIYRV